MEEDDLSRQADEVEALTSIFGSDWLADDADKRVYKIKISNDENQHKINLQVTMPEDYPSKSPPIYQLNAPWMKREEKLNLDQKLQDIYCENIGENIIFLWIEAIREFLQERTDSSVSGDTKHFDDFVDESHKAVVDPSMFDDVASSHNDDEKCPVIHHSDFLHDRKSNFQAHLAEVHSVEEVKMVMQKLLSNRKIEAATHNIQAYRIVREQPKHLIISDCVDDGEHGASGRMLNVMELAGVENALVVVTRWYGGIHLGPDRFKHINAMTRDILLTHGYIKIKEKKGPRSKKQK